MPERKILVIIKRINGEWFRVSSPHASPDMPFRFHLSGGIRDYTGQSHFIEGQQEINLQVFPGEQVELSEEAS